MNHDITAISIAPRRKERKEVWALLGCCLLVCFRAGQDVAAHGVPARALRGSASFFDCYLSARSDCARKYLWLSFLKLVFFSAGLIVLCTITLSPVWCVYRFLLLIILALVSWLFSVCDVVGLNITVIFSDYHGPRVQAERGRLRQGGRWR